MNDVLAELRAVIESVATALQGQGVQYFISGSFASSVHGEFRATNDVDFVAALEPRHLDVLAGALSDEFIVDRESVAEALASGRSFNLIHRGTYLKVDVFPLHTAFDREAAGRAVEILMPSGTVPIQIATAEDVLLAKLRWYRLGDEASEVQRRDIEKLVTMNRETLDRAYLDRWSEILGVRDLLDRFILS